ncbi:putative zinc finger protein [Nemania sp. FL0916]|nr:putative zinc finger protein [Nemania sp. FL0916]
MTDQLSQSSSVDDAVSEFKNNLGPQKIAMFRRVSLRDLKTSILKLQRRQDAERQLRDLSQMQPFLDALEQLEDMTKTIVRDNDSSAFFWGPTQFLLLETARHDVAFCELLKVFRRMGQSLPHLPQYKSLFEEQPHLGDVLPNIYKTILNFQLDLLRYFEQEEWRALFNETWDTHRRRATRRILETDKYKSLIESKSSSSTVQDTQRDIQQSRQTEDDRIDEQDLQRLREVSNWLNAATVCNDHNRNVSARENKPSSGRWLLDNAIFANWFDPKFPAIPPLLWINGIPGAGKSVLASLIIEEARKLKPAPTVLYFYCKEGDSSQDNFGAICRTMLFQMLEQDRVLLNTLYPKCCRSGEKELRSEILTKDLLGIAFRSCKSAYIILDGLDECPREEQKRIINWFRELVESLPTSEPERLRCLFVSRGDGRIRNLCEGLESIKITPEHNKSDIENYNQMEASILKSNYPSLPSGTIGEIVEKISKIAKGQFLLAKLIWNNLHYHASSVARLEEELAPGVFPETINDAYRRIMVRINLESPENSRGDIMRLLGWIVCAKRPLKWHEIQAMNSIDLDERRVDIERRSFFRSPSELCGSLIEEHSDGTVDLVHATAKSFLLHDKVIDISTQELRLAILCIDYLNLPVFLEAPINDDVLNGDFAFIDYAVIYWLHHLEAGVTLMRAEREQLTECEEIDELSESLKIFISQHWNSPTASLNLANRHKDKLSHFSSLPCYDQLEQAVASTKKQLKHLGSNLKKEEIALNLSDIVANFRVLLEQLLSEPQDPSHKSILHQYYGTELFKCSRFSCRYFSTGLSSAAERDRHVNKHERPFRCSFGNCTFYSWGFSSETELENHLRNNHPVAQDARPGDNDFPTIEEIERGNRTNQPTDNETRIPEAESTHESPEPEAQPPRLPPQKRQRRTEFICEQCGEVYKKKYNLQSHQRTHEADKTHVCEHCGKRFRRESDLNRHLKIHTGEKEHECQGCGRSFARAETLRQHWDSKVGRACIQSHQQQTIEEQW